MAKNQNEQEFANTPEMQAEATAREAEMNRVLHGDHVVKVGDVAVIELDGTKVAIPLPLDYGKIVSALIEKRYPSDQKDAILANYDLVRDGDESVSEEKRAEYTEEYHAYQQWRKDAKAVAAEILPY